MLGPTEDPFVELVEFASEHGASDLRRGSRFVDSASLTGYTLFVFAAEVELHDGLARSRRTTPLLVRYSGAGAFEVAWESLMSLRGSPGQPAQSPTPGMRAEAHTEAGRALRREVDRLGAERVAWARKARDQLNTVEYRYLEELEELPPDARKVRSAAFTTLKTERLTQLGQIEHVAPTQPRLVGWADVTPGVDRAELGYDPNAEKVAIRTVLDDLQAAGFSVDDRQTAGVGYDLLARHRVTKEQRLVEVKGFTEALGPVWLEQHEWAQALQRGPEFWLYVVVALRNCADHRSPSPRPCRPARHGAATHRAIPDSPDRASPADGDREVTGVRPRRHYAPHRPVVSVRRRGRGRRHASRIRPQRKSHLHLVRVPADRPSPRRRAHSAAPRRRKVSAARRRGRAQQRSSAASTRSPQRFAATAT